MTEKTFILEFALKYGFKEGFVLSEMCREIFSTREKKNSLVFDEIKDTASIFSERQIRTVLDRLAEKNCITKQT